MVTIRRCRSDRINSIVYSSWRSTVHFSAENNRFLDECYPNTIFHAFLTNRYFSRRPIFMKFHLWHFGWPNVFCVDDEKSEKSEQMNKKDNWPVGRCECSVYGNAHSCRVTTTEIQFTAECCPPNTVRATEMSLQHRSPRERIEWWKQASHVCLSNPVVGTSLTGCGQQTSKLYIHIVSPGCASEKASPQLPPAPSPPPPLSTPPPATRKNREAQK